MRRRRDTADHPFVSQAFRCKRLFGSLVLAGLWFWHFLDMLWFAGVGVVLVLAFNVFFVVFFPLFPLFSFSPFSFFPFFFFFERFENTVFFGLLRLSVRHVRARFSSFFLFFLG